jgi:alpha-amylase/alpha-mannosidase (GH57 family)
VITLCFLWHQHQPDYRHPESGVSILPWVRLHAVKGYHDMLSVLERYGHARCVVNFSGILLEQLTAYAGGLAQDYFAEVSKKPAAELTPSEREFVLTHFFSGNPRALIEPHQRYRELRVKRDTLLKREEISRAQAQFSEQELADLMVWFNLGWIGFAAGRRLDVAELVTKGRDYSLEHQHLLMAIHEELIRSVLPGYKRLLSDDRIELSFTPHHHPIMPLVIDLADLGHSSVDDPLPEFRFPEDASEHIRRGMGWFTKCFGQPPRGAWPAEGSVSDTALELLAGAGLNWAATDQQNLPHEELQPLGHFMPRQWQHNGCSLHVFFRDTRLADNISFEYSSWQGRLAGAHLLNMVRAAAERSPYKSPVITIALDGENPWENYRDGGESFLCALFEEVAAANDICCRTPSEIIEESASPTISTVKPGSWIGGNFDIWSRHPETRTAWRRLARARHELIDVCSGEVQDQLLAAEASDWFWWYGDDFETEQAAQFDELFRMHLVCAYRAAGRTAPDELFAPIASERSPASVGEVECLISPQLDGRVTNYFEWQGAVQLAGAQGRSAMARGSEEGVTSLWYGFSEDALWLRLDLANELQEQLTESSMELKVHISQNGLTLDLNHPADDLDKPKLEAKAGKIVEARIGIEESGIERSKLAFVWLELVVGTGAPLRYPATGRFPVFIIGADFACEHWSV